MIKADDFGWFIDLPCSICRKDNCPGAVHVWLPNKIGNVENGYETVNEAMEDAKDTLCIHSSFCESN